MNALNYLWRLFATGFGFSVFGLGGLILTLIVFPLINLVVPVKSRVRVARKVVSQTFRFFIALIDFLGIFDFDLAEAERFLADQKGKVIVANHPSLIDVVILISIVPHADCVVKKELWKNPFLKGVVKAANYIKNDENPEILLESCRKSLEKGYSLVIFPEGTRTKPGQSVKLQRGASNIALRCEADVVPVVIECHPTTLTKNEPWYKIPERKAQFSVCAATPILIAPFLDSENSLSVSARRLTEEIKSQITGK